MAHWLKDSDGSMDADVCWFWWLPHRPLTLWCRCSDNSDASGWCRIVLVFMERFVFMNDNLFGRLATLMERNVPPSSLISTPESWETDGRVSAWPLTSRGLFCQASWAFLIGWRGKTLRGWGAHGRVNVQKYMCSGPFQNTHTHTHRHRHRHTHTHSLISGWVSHRQSPGPWVTLRPPCFSRRSTTRDRERMGSFVSTYLLHGTPGWEQREEQQVRPYVWGQRWDETTLCRFICQVGPELLWLQQVSSDQSSP